MPTKNIIYIGGPDEQFNRMLETACEQLDLETEISSNATEVITAIHHGVSLLILDISDVTKFDALRILRDAQTTHSKTPVFVIANPDQQELIKQSVELGAARFFVKTQESLEELMTEIQKLHQKTIVPRFTILSPQRT